MLGIVLLSGHQSLASPEERPTWGGGHNSNSVSAETGLPSELLPENILWERKLGTRQYTIPTFHRGKIYIGINDQGLEDDRVKSTRGGLVLCLDQKTGKTVWQLPIPRFYNAKNPPHFFNHLNCGVCSSPVIEGKHAYLISGRGEVLCLDIEGQANGNDGIFKEELSYMGAQSSSTLRATDGDIIWRYNMVTESSVYPHDCCGSTVLILGDLLFACTSNGVQRDHKTVTNPLAPSLIVLDRRTGRLIAQDGEEIGKRMLHGQWSTPIRAEVDGKVRVVFGAGDGVLYAFEPPDPRPKDGKVQILKKLWASDCNPPEYRERNGKRIPYATRQNKNPLGPSEVIATPVLYRNRIYVAIGQDPMHGPGQGMLSCIDAATGNKVWSSTLVKRSLSTVSIHEGLLYIPDYSRNLHCFDADTGERIWVRELDSGVWCSSTLVADGKIYVSTENKKFWILKAGRKGEVISQTRLKQMAITPVAADGVLYIPNQRSLIAYRDEGDRQ